MHTLTKWQAYWKEQLANWYGMFLHEAMYGEPVMRNIESFLQDSQRYVSGTVQVRMRPYSFELLGIESEHDLMNCFFRPLRGRNERLDGRRRERIYEDIVHALADL